MVELIKVEMGGSSATIDTFREMSVSMFGNLRHFERKFYGGLRKGKRGFN